MRIMSKIAVVGDKDSVLAFKALGVEVFTPIGASDIAKCVNKLAKDYGVIFITESFAEKIPEVIKQYSFESLPSIVFIPDNQGTKGLGMAQINKNMEKAVGMNIL